MKYKLQRRLPDVLPIQRRQVMQQFTSNGTDRYQNSSSNLLTPYREQPRSTLIVVAYQRPVLSVTRRTNHAPISFDQQVQVSQGHTSCRNKENCNTEVDGGGGLELVKLAREPASRRSKSGAFLKNGPKVLPVRRSLLVLVGRKSTVARDQLFPQKPPGSRL